MGATGKGEGTVVKGRAAGKGEGTIAKDRAADMGKKGTAAKDRVVDKARCSNLQVLEMCTCCLETNTSHQTTHMSECMCVYACNDGLARVCGLRPTSRFYVRMCACLYVGAPVYLLMCVYIL